MARGAAAPAFPTALAAGLVALAVLTHAPAFVAGYVQDDHIAVEANPVVERGDPVEILTSSYWKGAAGDDSALYRPVAIGSYALERRLASRPSPALSHTVNLLLHAAASLLLAIWARRLGLGAAASALAAALFAVHPGASEAVYNVVGRAEILACLFAVAGLLAFTWTAPWPAAGGEPVRPAAARAAAWSTAVLLFLAMASKEGGIVLAGLLPLQELLFRPPPRGTARPWLVDRAGALAPCGLALVAWIVLRTVALEAFFPLQSLPPFDNPLVAMDPASRVRTALGLVARYARIVVFPSALSNDYSGPVIGPERSWAAPLPLVGAAVLVASFAAALGGVVGAARARRIALGACLALASYLVTANLLFPVGASMAERFLYMPMAGIALSAAAFAEPWIGNPARRKAVAAVAGAALAALSMRTFVRGLDWTSDETIFTAAIRTTPSSPRSHFALGKLLTRTPDDSPAPPQRLREAIPRFERAIALWPDYNLAKLELGLAHARLGDLDAAERLFRDVLARIPEDGTCNFNLGLVLERRGRKAEAERWFRKAVLHDPGQDRAWASLGHLAFDDGRFGRAAEAYSRAVELGREDLRGRLSESRRRATAP